MAVVVTERLVFFLIFFFNLQFAKGGEWLERGVFWYQIGQISDHLRGISWGPSALVGCAFSCCWRLWRTALNDKKWKMELAEIRNDSERLLCAFCMTAGN